MVLSLFTSIYLVPGKDPGKDLTAAHCNINGRGHFRCGKIAKFCQNSSNNRSTIKSYLFTFM